MAIESPLFQSGMELLGHGLGHFLRGKELDRKLFILHLANAFELILKDLILDAGGSIYKNPKETLTVHGCIEALADHGISVPLQNKMELLIDERNALQHRFGSPNELTTIFYQAIALSFFSQVLDTHYSLDLNEVLQQFMEPDDYDRLLLRQPSNQTELATLERLAKLHPLGALLAVTSYLERLVIEFSKQAGLQESYDRRAPWVMATHRRLEYFGLELPADLRDGLERVRKMRNVVAHGRRDPTVEEAREAIALVGAFEAYLAAVDVEALRAAVAERLAGGGSNPDA